MRGGRWSTKPGHSQGNSLSGRYKAQGRTAALHLLGTSGGMPLSETMGLEIV